MIRILARRAAWLALAGLTCACSVQPGLANAPKLGGTSDADPRVHDAIANGLDSCGRALDPGPLRNRIVPCPRVAPPRSQPMTLAPSTDSNAIVAPWVEHFYWSWPCAPIAHKSRPLSPELSGNNEVLLIDDAAPTRTVAFSNHCPALTAPK